MSSPRASCTIERLFPPLDEKDAEALARLLIQAVDSGAAVSFLSPLSLDAAKQWWRTVATADADPRTTLLAARDAEGIVGTVQLHPAWAPNQPHRAEVTKLLVHPRARRNGLATQLMSALEEQARRQRFTLLTLDAKAGADAERLYRNLGWIAVGEIPDYALDPDGRTLHGAVLFYKDLRSHDDGATPS